MRGILIALLMMVGYEMIAQVTVREDPKVAQLMESYTAQGKSEETINGWRIKLISTTDRRKMEATRGKFSNLYPDRKFSSSYENPYYSLKTGAFESRFELEPYLEAYKMDFPEAIIFRDRVLKTDLFKK